MFADCVTVLMLAWPVRFAPRLTHILVESGIHSLRTVPPCRFVSPLSP